MGERIVYEIVNPSDACTIVATDPLVATLACLLLGNGAYMLRPDPGCPLFLGAGEGAVDDWALENHGDSFGGLLDRYALEIAECLDSFLYGGPQARADYEDARSAIESEEAREIYRQQWFDRRRTSMNNIGQRADGLARLLRSKVEKAAS